ncbi:Surface antigen [Flavobacteriaceae bacterium MAR_2010_188]|nr:Surface antigen [Flavobacteriaceae bacterium MAR_2010_188]
MKNLSLLMSKLLPLVFCFLALCFSTTIFGQHLHLNLIGKNTKENRILDSLDYQKKFSDFETLNAEVDSTLIHIERLGFYNREFFGLKKTNDSTYSAKIHLNNQYQWIQINSKSLLDIPSIQKEFTIIEGNYLLIPIYGLENSLNRISEILSRKGGPFFKIRLVNIKRLNSTTITAEISSSENANRRIDKILVKGYEKFPRSFIKNYLRIRPNQSFDINKVKSKTRRMENLRWAKSTKDPEILFTADSTILYIYVEKNISNQFDGFLGFGTDDDSGKLQFDGYLNLNLLNNLNYGESFELYYKSDESDQRTFDVKIALPYLFGSPIGIKTKLNIFKKDSTFLTSEQRAAVVYQINNKHVISAGLSSVKSDLLEGTETSTLNDFKSTLYNVEYSFDELNDYNLLFPVKTRFNLFSEIGNREVLGKSTKQTKFTLETYKIVSLNYNNSIFGRITGGYLISDNYLENELFRFGGINSIRGFKENTLIANLFGVLNTEYRYLLNPGLYVHTVFDAAYLENSLTNQKEKLIGFGAGFGLLTKAGLLKLSYSGSKVNNQNINLSDFKIHISLNASF